MNTNPQYRRPMSETPEKFPVLVFEKGRPYVVDKDEWWRWPEFATGWQPLEILPEAPRELTQEEKDVEAFNCWDNDGPGFGTDGPEADAWHAALAWERSRNAEGREQIEARLKETEARLAQQCEALKSYVDRFEAMRVRNVEIKEIAALLPKLDDFDGTFNAVADLLDECGVNVRISDAMRQLHARLSASAEKGQS